MDLVVYGSKALNRQLDRIIRDPKDIDMLGAENDIIKYCNHKGFTVELNNGTKIIAKTRNGFHLEGEIIDNNIIGQELFNYILNDPETIINRLGYVNLHYASKNVQYTLKMSHRYKKNSSHFIKTMADIHLLRRVGAAIPADLNTWFKKREKETYTYNHPTLVKNNKENFFGNNGIVQYFIHDEIHEVVSFSGKPAYTYYQPEGNEVETSKELFFNQPKVVQLLGGLEESYVLALERSQIPNKFNIIPRKSFNMALMKVCTSITSGWFREFCWENYNSIITLYDDNYVNVFKNAMMSGRIKQQIPFDDGTFLIDSFKVLEIV